MEPKKIYEVAIYLRKSRDDSDGEENVLLKHETALTDLARQNNWRYVIYRGIGSLDSIEYRPEFKRLLSDVENDFYDAVVVIDYDRLSRGDKEDRARIEKILKRSNTVVVTPTRVYDLNDEDQELITDIEGVFARVEYEWDGMKRYRCLSTAIYVIRVRPIDVNGQTVRLDTEQAFLRKM